MWLKRMYLCTLHTEDSRRILLCDERMRVWGAFGDEVCRHRCSRILVCVAQLLYLDGR
jgi:hypothetical protein